MIVRLLKDRGLLPLMVTVAMVIGLGAWGFSNTDVDASNNELLISHWALGWLYRKLGWSLFIGIVLIAGSTVLIRSRTRLHRLLHTSGNLTLLIWLAVLFTQSNMLLRPDVLAAGFAIIAMFILLYSTRNQENALSQMFHVGLMFGFASILVGQTMLFAVAIYFSLIILRSGNWREWSVPFLGVLMVGVFLFLFLVWVEEPFLEFQRLIRSSWTGPLATAGFSVGHIVLSVALLMAVPNALRSLTTGSVAERNHLLSLLTWIIIAVLCVPILGLGWQVGAVFAAFPLSIFVSRALQKINRWWLADMILIGILAAPFLSNLMPL